MSKKFRWGIIGLGKIAHKFAHDVQLIPNAEVYAVASSSKERAADFAAKYGAQLKFNSYEELARCGEIDANLYCDSSHRSL